jgi:uncharacterized damage-inducible protein DinB
LALVTGPTKFQLGDSRSPNFFSSDMIMSSAQGTVIVGVTVKGQLELMAEYHAWATKRLVAVVARLPDDIYRKPSGLFFDSIHGTMNHLLLTDAQIWFPRFAESRSASFPLDAEIEPDRTTLATRLVDAAALWSAYVDTVDDRTLDGDLSYTTTKGEQRTLPLAATLLHVFNHATHHRGQVTAAISGAGFEFGSLDLLGFIMLRAAR